MALTLAVALLLAMAVAAPVAAARPKIYVPDDHATIQAAVNAATARDTIIVRAGVYNESVLFGLANSNITLKAEGRAILDGGSPTVQQDGITLSGGVSGVTIQGFEIRNYANTGIYLSDASSNKVKDNVVFGSQYGILLDGASSNKVKSNVVSSSVRCGIVLVNLATSNEVKDNVVFGSYYGIYLKQVSSNKVKDNAVSGTGLDGIWLDRASSNEVKDNVVSRSGHNGIRLDGASTTNNNVKENVVLRSGASDAYDLTTGGGTAGTANNWTKNICRTSSPDGLCARGY